jgi:hypothetical protein
VISAFRGQNPDTETEQDKLHDDTCAAAVMFGEMILTVSVALGCALLGCGAVQPRQFWCCLAIPLMDLPVDYATVSSW